MAKDVGFEYINEDSINERLKCSICTMPFIEPVVTNCRLKRHIFCRPCIKEWVKQNPSCPTCRDKINLKDLKVVAECYLLDSLNELQVKCKTCGQTGVERAKFDEHYNKYCPKVITSCPLAEFQCTWKGPLDQVDKHLNSCVFKPLIPLISHLKDQINELRVTNQQLEKRLRKTESCFEEKMIKLYDLVPSSDSLRYFSPNPWKTRMSLLHKGVQFETIPVTLIDVRRDLATRSKQADITIPAIELPNGEFIYDSYRIAEWLEDTYPDRPSLFTGDGQPTNKAQPEHLSTGKNYARMIDLGLGASKPQWAVWFDLFFPRLDQFMAEGEVRNYFRSDARLGPQGYQKLMSLDREELIRRAKMNIQPLLQILRERPNEYFQGKYPGQVDYVIFGRYAYCRMLDAKLTKQIWEDQGKELANWIDKLSSAHNEHALKIFQSFE